MRIENGDKKRLYIRGVFDGLAGVAGPFLSFVPNLGGDASGPKIGSLAGVPVSLAPVKDATGPFWTSRYEVIE